MVYKKHEQLQVFINSPIPQFPIQTLTLNSTQTWGDLKKTLTSSIPSSSSSSSFLSINGRILQDSSRIGSSNITPLSTLNLHVKLIGGGGDGGATGAESRDCYLKMYAEKKPDKVDPNEKRLSKWTTCALSFEPLKPPCVIDRLGNVFNKEALVKALLAKSLPKPFSQYIKGLKDLIPIHLQQQHHDDDSDSASKFMCPISEVDFNGMYKFFALTKCGHVLSAKALKEVRSSACLVCHQEFGEEDKIAINGSEDEVEVLRKRMIAMKESAREEKKVGSKAKKASKMRSNSGDDDHDRDCDRNGVVLSGKKHGSKFEINGSKFELDAKLPNAMVANKDGQQQQQQGGGSNKRFKAVDVAPANANKEVYASIFTSSRKTEFKETYSCRSLPLGRN